MTEKATGRIHNTDREQLGSIAEVTSQNIADLLRWTIFGGGRA